MKFTLSSAPVRLNNQLFKYLHLVLGSLISTVLKVTNRVVVLHPIRESIFVHVTDEEVFHSDSNIQNA